MANSFKGLNWEEHFQQSDLVLEKLNRKSEHCICMVSITNGLHMYKLAKKYRQKGIEYALAGMKLCAANIDLIMTGQKHHLYK